MTSLQQSTTRERASHLFIKRPDKIYHSTVQADRNHHYHARPRNQGITKSSRATHPPLLPRICRILQAIYILALLGAMVLRSLFSFSPSSAKPSVPSSRSLAKNSLPYLYPTS